MNLEKVIKVTQSQYDILASGGRVGDYVGLDDNYLYLIEDENEYLPITGGTITGDLTINGNTTFKNNSTYTPGKGIEFQYNNGAYTGTGLSINCDNWDNEIIYLGNDDNGDTLYKPLLVDDNSAIIYSNSGDYHVKMDLATSNLVVNDENASGNYITLSPYDNCIYYYDSHHDIEYSYALPQASGTLALTSDVINVVANPQTTTATLSSITIGNTNYAIQGGVSDVQINGTSILSNTVANILTNSSYSSSNKIATMSDLPAVSLTTTTGSESITVGSDTLNVMTRDTVQTIGGSKTFTNTINSNVSNGNNVLSTNTNWTINKDANGKINIGQPNNDLRFYDNNIRINSTLLRPQTDNITDIGTANYRIKNIYLSNNLSDGTNSITVAEVVAKQDAIEVKRYI